MVYSGKQNVNHQNFVIFSSRNHVCLDEVEKYKKTPCTVLPFPLSDQGGNSNDRWLLIQNLEIYL